MVLSQFFEESYAVNLIGERPEGLGYLLKERVGDVAVFIDAVRRVAAGGTALDPEIVARMMGRRRDEGPLDELTPRDRDVLREMAEGKSNRGIAETLFVSEAAVEKHVSAIFRKLGIESTANEHRRVLAVVRYLREAGQSQPAIGSR
jgi:DNA-binding NarL/FixJ family response regulator